MPYGPSFYGISWGHFIANMGVCVVKIDFTLIMKEFPESEIQAKFFADKSEKRRENLAKNFADFRPLITRKSVCKKFDEKSSTFSTRDETQFFHREILEGGCPNIEFQRTRTRQKLREGVIRRSRRPQISFWKYILSSEKMPSVLLGLPWPSPEPHLHSSQKRLHTSMSVFGIIRSRPGKPNQIKAQNEKFMNFAHFCEFWCFSLGKQARFTLNFCSGMPLRKVHELTFLWFGLPGPLLKLTSWKITFQVQEFVFFCWGGGGRIHFPNVTYHIFVCDSENYMEKMFGNYFLENLIPVTWNNVLGINFAIISGWSVQREASPAVLKGREFWKCSLWMLQNALHYRVWHLGDPSCTVEGNSRKSSESVPGVFPEIFQNFLRKVLPVPQGPCHTKNTTVILIHYLGGKTIRR